MKKFFFQFGVGAIITTITLRLMAMESVADVKIVPIEERFMEQILNDFSNRHAVAVPILERQSFKQLNIGEDVVVYSHRKIGAAKVEKDKINYQFDARSGQLKSSVVSWRDDLPDVLPKNLLSSMDAEILVRGEFPGFTISYVQLTYISPSTAIFRSFDTPRNPVWVVGGEVDDRARILVIDGMTGDFLGEGSVPPHRYTYLSVFDITEDPHGTWQNMTENAHEWYAVLMNKNFRYTEDYYSGSVGKAYFEILISNPSTTMFYEMNHGGFYEFSHNNFTVSGVDVHNWMSDRTKMMFTFIASCEGMCKTENPFPGHHVLAHEFQKGSNQYTATVGYCHMGENTTCEPNCWPDALDWQDTYFGYLADGMTIGAAFHQARLDYPGCFEHNQCIKVSGDLNFSFDDEEYEFVDDPAHIYIGEFQNFRGRQLVSVADYGKTLVVHGDGTNGGALTLGSQNKIVIEHGFVAQKGSWVRAFLE